MLTKKGDGFRIYGRSLCKYIFHLVLDWLGIQRLREHSFFAALLSRPVIIGDFGAHDGEFFTALRSEYSISRALLVEANPALVKGLKERLGKQADVLHAALIGGDRNGSVTFTRSIQPESSSVFRQWAAAYGIMDQVEVAAMNFGEALKRLGGGRIDLVKFDIEGAEFPVLQSASASDLASCGQLTVEFHEKRSPFTRCDVANVCQRLRSEGYGIVNANWPKVDDVLFVNLKSMSATKRMEFRCRMALANALFIVRRVIFRSGYS